MKIVSVKSFFALYIIITLTILSTVLMFTVLFVYNNSIDTIIENSVYEKLKTISFSNANYIEDRKLMLKDVASNRFVINGLIDESRYFTTTVNYLENVKFLNQKYSMTLLNFKGDVLTIAGELLPLSSMDDINKVLDGSIDSLVDSVIINEISYIRIYAPVKRYESIQGVLMVAIPVDRDVFFRSMSLNSSPDLAYIKDKDGDIFITSSTNTDEFLKNNSNEKDFIYSKKIDNTDLTLFYKMNTDDIIVIRNRLIKASIASSLIVLIIVIYTNLLLGNYFFVKPLSKLQKNTLNLLNGKKYGKLKINTVISEIDFLDTTLGEVSKKMIEDHKEILNNIETLKKAQNKIIESEKIAGLSNLVVGIAHEVNTPLGVSLTANSYIVDNTKKINEKLENGELTKLDFEKYLNIVFDSSNMVLSNLDRAAKLINHFKSIPVTQRNSIVEKFNFREYLNKIINVIRPIYKKKVSEIMIECDENIEIVKNEGVFSQIITNLVSNSIIHGMKDKEEGIIKISMFENEKEYKFVYSDNGYGISDESKKKIFEPFFTTNRSEGTGLGMYIVYNLVHKELDGHIVVKNNSPTGTKFVITWAK